MKKKLVHKLQKMAERLPDQFYKCGFDYKHQINHVRRMKRALIRDGWIGVNQYLSKFKESDLTPIKN